MDGLLSFLTPEQQAMAERQAQQAMLTQLGFGLLQASTGAPGQRRPSLGQIVGQAGPGAMQAYQSGFDRTLQQIMLSQQMADQQRKRDQEQAALTRQQSIQQAMALPTTQQQVDALRRLGAYPELSALAGAEKTLKQSGILRGATDQATANPFAVYQQSNIPNVKKLADQFSKAYEQGTIDDEKATQRLGELARMEESAMAREQLREDRLSAEQSAATAREQARLDRLAGIEAAKLDRLINREAQEAEREAKRLEGTEGQRLAAGFAARMDAANAIIQQLEGSGGLPTVMTEVAASIPFVGTYAQRKAMTEQQQRYKQAADNWIRANLREESGAVIGGEEMAAEYRTYFPQPGDTPQVIAQKAQARQITTQAMKQNAGPVYRPTQGATIPTSTAPSVPSGVTVRRVN